MRAMLKHYLDARGREGGVTLVEMMVVCLLIGIIGGSIMMMMAGLFDSQIRAAQYLNTQTTIENYYGFMASRLATTQRGDIGLPYCKPNHGVDEANVCKPNGAPPGAYGTELQKNTECTTEAEGDNCTTIVDPLSVAGDQLVFESGDFCYRVFYINTTEHFADKPELQLQQIRAAVAPSCDELVPARGPSEPSGPEDPIIDELYDQNPGATKSFALANNIIPDRPANAPGDAPNRIDIGGGRFTAEVFRFYGAGDNTATAPTGDFTPKAIADELQDGTPGIDSVALAERRTHDIAAMPLFYRQGANRNRLAFVKGFAYLSPVEYGSQAARIPDRSYYQLFALSQVCDVDGGSGGDGANSITPGTMFGASTVHSGQGTDTWQATTAGTLDLNGSGLASEGISGSTMPQTIDFTAQVQMRASGSGMGTHTGKAEIAVVLERQQGGSWTETQDEVGLSRISEPFFTVKQVNVGGINAYTNPNGDAARISGSFHLPAGTGQEQWRLRVDVSNPTTIQHNLNKQRTFLAYKASASPGQDL